MAIIKIIVRKMMNNRWLTSSLFLGLLITVALVASIPIFTSGVLQKLLISDLDNHYIENQEYPGEFSYSVNFSQDDDIDRINTLENVEIINEDLINEVAIPLMTKTTILSTVPLKINNESGPQTLSTRIMSISNIEDHIRITDGSLPSEEIADNTYEALVPEKALLTRDMVLGNTFTITAGDQEIQIKPVGTFVAKDINDPFWTMSPDSYSQDFIIPESLYRNEMLKINEELLNTAKFTAVFDYRLTKKENINHLLTLERNVQTEVNMLMETIVLVTFPMKEILLEYLDNAKQLKTMLWFLNVPILVMLAIYLYMVSRLIIQRQLNEIAIFASRGAKRSQILFIYFLEILIMGLTAFIVGPYIGLLLSKLLGATNGFLEFIQRKSLPVQILPEAYVYGLVAVIASIIMIMIPVYFASKQSIVQHKQSIRKNNQKFYFIIFDLAMIGISIYGLYSFQKGQSGLGSEDLYIDPILFFLPAIFIIGLGLIILRIYPLLLMGIFKLGKKFWSLSLYSTLLQVTRSSRQYKFLMLFLIMTISIGVYSASIARTINSNLEEQILYRNGADVTLDVKWESNQRVLAPSSIENVEDEEGDDITDKSVTYTEPDFEPFLNLSQVEHVTKVFQKEAVVAKSKGKSLFSAKLMAIDPQSFGETAWFKPSLLSYHWYHYLNLLAEEPSAVLISKTAADFLGAKEGDYLELKWDGSVSANFVVYGIIEYWPTFNPFEKRDDGNDPTLIIANLLYVQNSMGLEPYQVWLKTKPNHQMSTLYGDIRENGIPIIKLNDALPQLIELKNSSFLLGLNGMLSLGFVISIMITLIGFLLYWILTMISRSLQYGIYRAMGISMPQLIAILFWEQMMTTVTACIIGIFIGGITSKLFVPMFQFGFNSEMSIPPFVAIFDEQDELKIYIFVLSILVVGLIVLIGLLRKIRIHQAIKLGED